MISNKPKRTRIEVAEDRLKKLEERAKELTETLKALEEAKKEKAASIERLKKASEEPRKTVNKKKILIGAMIMRDMSADPKLEKQILARLDEFLDRETDRKAFDLPARPPADQQS